MKNKSIPYEKSLAYKNPEIASQWHYEKNGYLKPENFSPFSCKRVWWRCPYDDPKTGKHFEFEWESSITNRSMSPGCPFLSNHAVWPGFNDLATGFPELAKLWHPTKNGDLKPENMPPFSDRVVWWFLPFDDPRTGKHFNFEWQEKITRMARHNTCPFLLNKKVWPGFNDLATIRPDLVPEWHPTKNGGLTSANIPAYSKKEVWWHLPYDDPQTGKHFDFEWQEKVIKRTKGYKCPFLTGQKVWKGFNDLATKYPEIAAQWHPSKNGKLTPDNIHAYSSKKVWWRYPYDDPKTGKHFDFEWKTKICSRTLDGKGGCPYLTNKAVWPGFNDLATVRPDLAEEWDYEKNLNAKPEEITLYSSKKRWWKCLFCEKSWYASLKCRADGQECGCRSRK